MTAKVLIIEGDEPTSATLVTVTISGPKSLDRVRVLKVLTHLFSTGSEWDGAAPNVRLVGEHTGDLVEA